MIATFSRAMSGGSSCPVANICAEAAENNHFVDKALHLLVATIKRKQCIRNIEGRDINMPFTSWKMESDFQKLSLQEHSFGSSCTCVSHYAVSIR